MAYTPTTWTTGDTITASAMNKIEQGIANSGGVYDAYAFIIKQTDTNTATLEKGNFSDIYDDLQDMKPVTGLYIKNTTPGTYYDTQCFCVPLTFTYYYSSANVVCGYGIYYDGSRKNVYCEISSSGSVTVVHNTI